MIGETALNTLEENILLMQNCTEEELKALQGIIIQFALCHSNCTKEQFLSELELARSQHNAQESKDAKVALHEIKEKYGL